MPPADSCLGATQCPPDSTASSVARAMTSMQQAAKQDAVRPRRDLSATRWRPHCMRTLTHLVSLLCRWPTCPRRRAIEHGKSQPGVSGMTKSHHLTKPTQSPRTHPPTQEWHHSPAHTRDCEPSSFARSPPPPRPPDPKDNPATKHAPPTRHNATTTQPAPQRQPYTPRNTMQPPAAPPALRRAALHADRPPHRTDGVVRSPQPHACASASSRQSRMTSPPTALHRIARLRASHQRRIHADPTPVAVTRLSPPLLAFPEKLLVPDGCRYRRAAVDDMNPPSSSTLTSLPAHNP